MKIYDWPDYLRPNKSLEWRLVNNSRSSGSSTIGSEQVISSPGGVWVCEGTLLLNVRKYGREWRLLRQRLSSRVNLAWMNFVDPLLCGSGALSFPGLPDVPSAISFSDGSFFSDGSGFAAPPLGIPVARAATKGAASIFLTYTGTVDNRIVGSFVAIDNWLYLVEAFVASGTNEYRVDLSPNLREDVTTSSVMQLSFRVLVRFLEADDSRLAIGTDTHETITIQLHEVIRRDGLSI